MPRRSPRFACPLLWLGYDVFDEHLLPCLSVHEAIVLAGTCKLMFIFTTRSIFTTLCKQMKGNLLRSRKIMTYDFFHDPSYSELKRIMKVRESHLVDTVGFLEDIIEKHVHYQKYPNVLFKSIFSDGRHISKWHCLATEVMVGSENIYNSIEPMQCAWQANNRKL